MPILRIDVETFNELTSALGDLIDFLNWTMEREDREAFSKLMPIVKRMNYLMVALIEGDCPQMSPIVDAIERLDDEVKECIAQAGTPEEKEQILREAGELFAEMQAQFARVAAEADRQEKIKKNEDGPLQ